MASTTVLHRIAILLLFLHLPWKPTSGANILFYFGVTGHSHISTIWPVVEGLVAQGHNITALTSILPKNTRGVTVVHVPEMFDAFRDIWDEGGDLVADRFNGRQLKTEDFLPIGLATCSIVLKSPAAQNVIHQSSFDLVVIDTSNECAVGLVTLKYGCPFVVFNALSEMPSNHDDFGIPVESSWIPHVEDGKPVETFLDRLRSTWTSLRLLWVRRTKFFPKLQQILMENLNLTEPPDFVELQKRTSLVLLNGYFTHGYSMSLPPLVVSVAGVGIQETRKPLSKELDDFISEAEDGFIYVSFGTTTTIAKMKPELRSKFFNAFGQFPRVGFLWKWDGGESPSGAPLNIHFGKWMPQQDLLAHPKCKGYISHGGTNGLNEGVYFGTPMLVFPIMGDQDYNGNALASKGLGLVMEITDFTEAELKNNIEIILHDEALKGRVKKAAEVFRDRPMKPVDTAVWWIEYVLRHGDTSAFLMPGAVNQTWYQRRLLDVWLFMYTFLLLTLVMILFIIRKLYIYVSYICGGRSKNVSKLKRN